MQNGVDAQHQHDLLHLNDGHRLVIGMVGLPARGKTHVALKICNYFSWLGYKAKHFEVAASRRETIGAVESETFFDPTNEMVCLHIFMCFTLTIQ